MKPEESRLCPHCDGTGKVLVKRRYDRSMTCENCGDTVRGLADGWIRCGASKKYRRANGDAKVATWCPKCGNQKNDQVVWPSRFAGRRSNGGP
jgi:RecJ-like exonuclease